MKQHSIGTSKRAEHNATSSWSGIRVRALAFVILILGSFTNFVLMQRQMNSSINTEKTTTGYNNDAILPLKSSARATSIIANTIAPNHHSHNHNNKNDGWSWATDEKPPSSPYAYAFVLGGIHEDRSAYKGFLYTILIAVNKLRALGSKADFVLWAQLSPDSKLKWTATNATNANANATNANAKRTQTQTLPADVDRWCRAMDVRVRLLDTEQTESFAQVVFEKFRVLSMTEYRRVIFLDGDVMPRSNMDYVFRLSDPAHAHATDNITNHNNSNNNHTITTTTPTTTTPTTTKDPVLRPNMILATRGEPCNTAMFMVSPSHDHWAMLQTIIARQREEGRKLPYPHFDWENGWGHNFEQTGTDWESVHLKNRTDWRFYAGHSDQGLMYYYARFANQDVSIVIGDRLQNFVPGDDGQPKKILDDWFVAETHRRGMEQEFPADPPKTNYSCTDKADFKCEHMPYKHMFHFSGPDKPWQHDLHNHTRRRNRNWQKAARLWYNELKKLNKQIDIGLDVTNWSTKHADHMQESPFGYLAKHDDHAVLVHRNTTTTAPPIAS